jgi:predicted HTH transcriptional regulator
LTNEQLADYHALGHELKGVEFKGAGLRTDQPLQAKIVRAALGMANRRSGGLIILGVDRRADVLYPTGGTSAPLASWRSYDVVGDMLNAYADLSQRPV